MIRLTTFLLTNISRTGQGELGKAQLILNYGNTLTRVRHHPPQIMVMAHVEGDTVIIDEDLTDRPLVDALVRAGIPREKIVLAYAGEPLPTG